jgi:hypothetical protein
MGVLDWLRGSKNNPVCDVCNRVLSKGEGYCLSTRQVVMECRYWEHTFTHLWNYLGTIDPEGRTLPMIVAQQGNQDSAWLVCDSCIGLFQAVDRSRSRAICQQWWKTGQKSDFSFPGSGPVFSKDAKDGGWDSLRDAVVPAGEGWSKSFGFTPTGILEEPTQATLAALDKHNPGLGAIVRQKSQAFFGALKQAAPASKAGQASQAVQNVQAPTVPKRLTQTEAQTLKALAESAKSVTYSSKLGQMGAAEGDLKRKAVYYLAALERKPGEKSVLSGLDFVQSKGIDVDEIRVVCGFSATDALAPTSFSCPTLEAPPAMTEDGKRKARALFEQAHNAPFKSHAQLELYLKALGSDPNSKAAWNEFGMLIAAAGRYDLADQCDEAIRVLDVGKFLRDARDLLGQTPLQPMPSPAATKTDQSSRYWKCPKCKGILKRSGDPSPEMPGFDAVIGTVTCGGCQESFPREVIYGGMYDVPEIRVICPHCSASLKGPDELIGKTCPSCKRPLPPR